MTEPALSMLLERLLWPVPRVRWEVGRSLARLIREGDREVVKSLLDWISVRRLESEAVLGLGVIDAFDLGTYFDFAEVSEAVQAPSHLSDWLLKKNFADACGLSTFRYTVSPPEPATLPRGEEAMFERYREWAVPPIFSTVLSRLHKSTGFSFPERWEHDWRWLQATDPRPAVEYPYFFSHGNRDRTGQFDHGQRELYVSAYLRTLAFAAISGAIPHHVAEQYALLALTMNRGLADLEPIDRPEWSRSLLPCDAEGTHELARKLWEHAKAAAKPGEVPLALRVADVDTENFIELDTTLTIGPTGFTAESVEADELYDLIVDQSPGSMTGLVGRQPRSNPPKRPLVMSQGVLPEDIGRVHIEVALNIRLASPDVFGTFATVHCDHAEIRLEAGAEVFSRWVHWYANWEPTISPKLKSTIGSMTTVSKTYLDRLRALPNVEIARLVQVRRAARPASYKDYEFEEEAFWA